MLVITRRENERLYIGDNIVVTIVRVQQNGGVRLGIEAPQDVNIRREEVPDDGRGGRGNGGT